MKYTYKPKAEVLICGDMNTYYLTEINLGRDRTREGGRGIKAASLLTTHNQLYTVNYATYATSIQCNSSMANQG